jgi:hypothetical protein
LSRPYHVAEEEIDVSYQLEREMHDRVTRYLAEAAVQRELPHGKVRSRLAAALRSLADRMEPRRLDSQFPVECGPVALHGRNR